MRKPNPWFTQRFERLDTFVCGMLELGSPVETLLVGVFFDEGRGAQRDIDLAMHQDGVYSEQLAKDQGNMYVEHKGGVDIVGFYCIRDNPQCTTLIQEIDSGATHTVILKTGEALIFDNRRVKHARQGPVGDRLLLRLWIKEPTDG